MDSRKRLLMIRWAAAGLLVPLALGGISWLAYLAKLGFLSEALAGPALFAAPLSPFLIRPATSADAHGGTLFLIGAAVLLGNLALYAAVGALSWRLGSLPRVNRLLRLTLVIGVGFAAVSVVASLIAFTR